MINFAFPLTANSKTLSSLGSRQAIIVFVISINLTDLTNKTQNKSLSIEVMYRSNFGLANTSCISRQID